MKKKMDANISSIREAMKSLPKNELRMLGQGLLQQIGTFDTDYMTVKELCGYLKVSRTSIYKYAKDNILHPIRIGGKVLFSKQEVETSLRRKEANNG